MGFTVYAAFLSRDCIIQFVPFTSEVTFNFGFISIRGVSFSSVSIRIKKTKHKVKIFLQGFLSNVYKLQMPFKRIQLASESISGSSRSANVSPAINFSELCLDASRA